MKFVVRVNNKYLVQVESTSNGGAENLILRSIAGSTSALAYDADTMKGDMFQYDLANCEFISFDELKRKADTKLATIYEHYNEMLDEEREYDGNICRLEIMLDEAKRLRESAIEKRKEYEREASNHGIYSLKGGYIDPRKIESLRK